MSLIKPLKKDDFKVYHYIKKGNTALEVFFSLNKNADLSYYLKNFKRTQKTTHKEIVL